MTAPVDTPTSPVLATVPLGFPWPTLDPFLFCAHHDDQYPAGNDQMGPTASLEGRDLGQDFAGKDGWRMYHGRVVPGFPQHPHRGFETVTVVRTGLIDHSDSLGAAARFGRGDCQWLTAGSGILHAEMFPLLDRAEANPVELFQIWLNLPARDKLAPPHFTMFWAPQIPTMTFRDPAARATEVTVYTGALGDLRPGTPPPRSWAAQPEHEVAIWQIRMEPGATWTLPPAGAGANRVLYFFRGATLVCASETVRAGHAVQLQPDVPVTLVAGDADVGLLLLQGRPIGEPVAQYGPFVMNTRAEIQQAFADYQRTEFGGWKWDRDDPVHPREQGRFARHADGRRETPAD